MSPEIRQKLRTEAIKDLGCLTDPDFGFLASGEGRYRLYFGRDSAKSIILSLSRDQGEITPLLIEHAIKSQEIAVTYEGRKFDPQTEEAPGKKAHEVHTKDSPQTRLAKMRENGWPVFENSDGTLGMVYYGSGDATSLFNISVAVVYRVLEKKDRKVAYTYLEQMWPFVEKGLRHDIEIADIDNDGLIEASPQNLNALLNHTEKDSNAAYRDEEGKTPKPPFKYLANNCDFVWSLRDSSILAKKLGMNNISREIDERRQYAQEKLNDVFWSQRLNYFVPLIDGNDKQVEIVADDPVEGLWGAVFSEEKAKKVIKRLSERDMLTKWGVRSRSSDSTQFNENGPGAYWNGLVWPHRNRILAEGAERYGYFDFAENIDAKTDALELEQGRVECVAVSKDGLNIFDYEENAGIAAACKPQCWTVSGSLARSAF